MKLFGLKAMIERHPTGEYTVTRQVERTYDTNGRLAAESPVTIKIKAHVQTAGRDADQVEDGTTQIVEGITFFTTTKLLSSGPPDQEADVITYQGRDYQVTQVKDWAGLGGFYKCNAELI